MQPFNMPEFYMPWPARVNPHLEVARAHTKAWAYEMGMLGSPQDAGGSNIWDERRFDAMDFALFAALTHPDVLSPELDLLSDWYVWGWFVDDYFPQVYKGSGDLADAKEYLLRLPEFISVHPTDTPPEPTNPVELGLADLWPRTAPTKSTEWRRRFSENIRNLAEEALRELFNLSQNKSRVPDLVEYIGMRRKVGGISWSADLVEHALGIEIPPGIYCTRPIRVLNETFADSAGLRNDIISYQKDVDEGKVNNGVVVAQQFLDCDLQQAVDVVNDLVTSRLYQFDNTAAIELPALFDEYGMGSADRGKFLTYVKGLKDWMAGDLEWALRPGGRYLDADSDSSPARPQLPSGPTGLGTAAARIGLSPSAMGLRLRSYGNVPRQTADSFELPQFYMPFSVRLNPHLGAVRKHAKAWAREMGLLGSLPDLPGKWGSNWEEGKWDSAEFVLFCALTHPDAPVQELELVTDWHVWGWYLKDYFLEVFKRRRDLLGAKVFMSRLPAFMPAEGTTTLVPTNPVERALADVWSRTLNAMSADLRRPLAGHVEDFARSHMWELLNLTQNRVPDPVDYIEMRYYTAFTEISIVLVLYALDLENPPEIYLTQPMRALAQTFGDATNTHNDIVAYQRRIEYEGEINHAVVVMQRFLGCDLQQTVNILNDLVTCRLRQFEYVVATELPALFDALGLDTGAREGALRYVEGLQAWMAGSYEWHTKSNRYMNTESQDVPTALRPLMVPTGLGASAARLGEAGKREVKAGATAGPVKRPPFAPPQAPSPAWPKTDPKSLQKVGSDA